MENKFSELTSENEKSGSEQKLIKKDGFVENDCHTLKQNEIATSVDEKEISISRKVESQKIITENNSTLKNNGKDSKIIQNDMSLSLSSNDESILLYNLDQMIQISASFTQQNRGIRPESRSMKEYLNSGVIYLDKPKNPSSHEVVTWIKNMLQNQDIEKTGHGGTLDPMVSGVLTVYLNRGTRLCTVAQHAGKEYVCVCKIEGMVSEKEIKRALSFFTGKLFQRPPAICAVKRNLRIREIKENEFIESKIVQEGDKTVTFALFRTVCQAGTYIRTLCHHIGIYLGYEASMEDLRRIRSGNITEKETITMHDLLDAIYMYEKYNNEIYLRRVVHPLERSLRHYKRIIVKDSAVAALCSGAKLTICGIVLIDRHILQGDMVVCVTLKGEAVCLSTALLSTTEIKILDYGIVAKTKRVIMEKGTYMDCWGSKKFNWF